MKFLVGSAYFFKGLNNFTPKDIDYVIIEDNPKYYNNTMTVRGRGQDIMFFKNRSKQDFIKMSLQSKLPMVVGKFLIPEFNQYIGFTLDDLKLLQPQFDKMDKKHLYEVFIYKCYLENNNFTLTQEQLKESFEIYKQNKI